MENLKCYGNIFKGNSWAKIFMEIRDAMLTNANEVESRIGKTLELINPTIILTDPKRNLFYSEKRKFSLIYALVESYKLFSDKANVCDFSFFNKTMDKYSDDGVTINSAYGQYIAPHIQQLCDKLKSDKDTRQAVIRIYDTHFGIEDETKDVPCTLNLHFMIRNDKLNLTTYMRSNDLIWGLQYDLFVFTALQQIVANEIGVDVGYYIHCPTSLHVYDYHWDLLKSIESVIEPKTIPFFDGTVQAANNANKIEEFVKVTKKMQAESVNNNILYKVKILRFLDNYNDSNIQMKLITNEILYKFGLLDYVDLESEDIANYKCYFKRWYK